MWVETYFFSGFYVDASIKDKVKRRLGFSFIIRVNVNLVWEALTRLSINIGVLDKMNASTRIPFRWYNYKSGARVVSYNFLLNIREDEVRIGYILPWETESDEYLENIVKPPKADLFLLLGFVFSLHFERIVMKELKQLLKDSNNWAAELVGFYFVDYFIQHRFYELFLTFAL